MKVCHIISGDLWAGAEAMALYLQKGLKEYKNIDLSAIILNEGRLAKEIRGLSIPVEMVDERKLSFPQIFSKIKKLNTKNSTDIIHSHRYKENILAYLVSKNNKGIKLVGTQHGMPEVYGDKRSLKYRLISRINFLILSKCFQNVVAVSKDIKDGFVNQYGFSEDKVKMIHNGIEVPEHISAKRHKEAFVIGSLGRFFTVKDYPLMVEVAREVLKSRDSIRFVLAGDGPEKLKILGLIEKYKMQSSFLLPGFSNDASSFYQELDLYLNTSLHEGIPISVLEAMSHGIPVVAPNVGGFEEILEDGVEGFLIRDRSPRSFAEKCNVLNDNGSLKMQMGLAAREKVIKEFSVGRMAEQYYRLYWDIIEGR